MKTEAPATTGKTVSSLYKFLLNLCRGDRKATDYSQGQLSETPSHLMTTREHTRRATAAQ